MTRNNNIIRLLAAIALFTALYGCKKAYITGGVSEDVNQYKNITTYDYLKSSPLYDTLVQLIDAAGLKDQLNGPNTTFFAPSDYSIYNYLNLRTAYVQNNINRDHKFGLDSLIYYISNDLDGTRDSLLMYCIPQSLPYSALTNTGAVYATSLQGDSAIVSYEFTQDTHLGYNSLLTEAPQIVYFTQLWYHYTPDDNNTAGRIPASIGVHTLVKTSGINTQNGIVDALDNSHVLFFYGTKQ